MVFLRKRILLFICLSGIILSNQCFSQNRKADSLYENFKGLVNSKQKFVKGFELISELVNSNESAYAKKVISDLEKMDLGAAEENTKQGLICIAKGLYFQKEDNIIESNKYGHKAARFLKNKPHYLSDAQTIITLIYLAASKHDSCIIYGLSVMQQVIASKNTTCEIEIYSAMSLSYEYVGNRHKAVELTLKAVQKAKQINSKSLLIKNYVNLASVYKQEDLGLAKHYGLLALKEIGNNKKSASLSATYLMLGNIYYDSQKLDSAEYYYLLCKDVSQKGNDQRMFLAAIGNLGNLAMANNNFEKAIDYNIVSLIEYKKLKLPTEILWE